MDVALQSTYASQASPVPYSLHIQLTLLYSALQSRHETQKREMLEYKSKANYWEVQFHQIKKREIELTNEIEELKSALRKREQQLFGRRSEKNTTGTENNPNSLPPEKAKKKRGHQVGSAGHGRSWQTRPVYESFQRIGYGTYHARFKII